jgi:coenzyme F420 hydrogenase subunit beta
MIIDEERGIYKPHVDYKKCSACGICIKVCPSFGIISTDFKEQTEDFLLGKHLGCYVGFSTNYDIRYNSSSGGLITQLLIFALEEGLINGALVTKMKANKPLEPEPFIARTTEEIIQASGSKYCPVPVNVALKKILNSKETERFAVVGLPCHIRGIRKAENMNQKLRKKIVLHFGLFCDHTPSFLATEFRLHQMNIKKREVKEIRYRGNGWPGRMIISIENNVKKTNHFWSPIFSYFFYCPACLLCSDALCELSDISFGDAWLPHFMKSDKVGTSLCISRTDLGDKLLHAALSAGKISLNAISEKEVVESQAKLLCFKKKILTAYMALLQQEPINISNINQLIKPSWIDYVLVIIYYLNNTYIPTPKTILYKLLKKNWILKSFDKFMSIIYSLSLIDFNKKLRAQYKS